MVRRFARRVKAKKFRLFAGQRLFFQVFAHELLCTPSPYSNFVKVRVPKRHCFLRHATGWQLWQAFVFFDQPLGPWVHSWLEFTAVIIVLDKRALPSIAGVKKVAASFTNKDGRETMALSNNFTVIKFMKKRAVITFQVGVFCHRNSFV